MKKGIVRFVALLLIPAILFDSANASTALTPTAPITGIQTSFSRESFAAEALVQRLLELHQTMDPRNLIWVNHLLGLWARTRRAAFTPIRKQIFEYALVVAAVGYAIYAPEHSP
jgi:hypothetical protein